MKAIVTFDDIYERIYPPELEYEEGMSDEQTDALSDHLEGVPKILFDMENAIIDRYKGMPDLQKEQFRAFDASLLRVAEKLLDEGSFAISCAALEIAGYVAHGGADDEGCLNIFNRFDNQIRPVLAEPEELKLTCQPGDEPKLQAAYDLASAIRLQAADALFNTVALIPLESPIADELQELCVAYGTMLLQEDMAGGYSLITDFAEACSLDAVLPGAVSIVEKTCDMADLQAGASIKTLLAKGQTTDALTLSLAMVGLATVIVVHYHDFPSLAARGEQALKRYYDITEKIEPAEAHRYRQSMSAECADKIGNEQYQDIHAGFKEMMSLVERLPVRSDVVPMRAAGPVSSSNTMAPLARLH
ncbi:MAG: hypothetical protein WCD70_10145 [Alphaproteobacteria bacterium]